MAIDKLNSLQFLLFRSDYFQEFGDRDGVYVDRVPFELRLRLLRWTWPTTARDQYFFQHEGRDVITRDGWEAFVRWACRAMDRQLGAEGEATGTIDSFLGLFAGRTTPALTIEDMNEIAAAGWAGELESVRLSGEPLESLAGIDEIINRGDHEAFAGLLHAIIEQPGGPVADRVRTLYERVQHRAADPEFAAWPQYQAAYWLAVAIGQFRLADVAQRQVPSDDPTIMHAVYVLADYPVLAALAAERTQATRLDGRACRAIYEDARQRIDWQAMPPYEREFAQRLGVGP